MIFNVKPLTDSGKDKLTGIQDVELSDISLFIDDAVATSSCNLTNADLTNATLYEVDLHGADLAGAKLNGSDLTGRNLWRANLLEVKLNGANLTNAFLEEANLSYAIYDPKTAWPTADYWNDTTCPDGTNSNDPGNAACGFNV